MQRVIQVDEESGQSIQGNRDRDFGQISQGRRANTNKLILCLLVAGAAILFIVIESVSARQTLSNQFNLENYRKSIKNDNIDSEQAQLLWKPIKIQQPKKLQKDKQIKKDPSKPQISISSGQLHYSRIPQQYWEHRIMMVKAMGPMAISTYIFWNYHEIDKGRFDFQSYGKNITHFIELVKKHGMKLWIRPGPYVCTEWDFGGFPARLLSVEGIRLRSNQQAYMKQVLIYFSEVARIIKPYTQGKNPMIQMLQIQNELGFLQNFDRKYMPALQMIWRKHFQIDIPLYYVDIIDNYRKSYFSGAVIGINSYQSQEIFKDVQMSFPYNLVIGGQFYSGWITHWKERQFGARNNWCVVSKAKMMLKKNIPFCIYLAHGGTNFGITSGANGVPTKQIFQSIITSNDFGASITQRGAPTPQYTYFRQAFNQYYSNQQKFKNMLPLPQIPQEIPTISFNSTKPQVQATILESLGEPFLKNISQLVYFECEKLKMWHQGIVVYETYLPRGEYIIQVDVRDFALVWLNDVFVTILDRTINYKQTLTLQCKQQKNKVVLLVQAMGHINFGMNQYTDRKGIVSFQLKKKFWQSTYSVQWNIYPILLNQTTKLFSFSKKTQHHNSPKLLKAQVLLQKTGDTFLNMTQFGKGYVWVNGHNLGRYWNVGPQRRLYCPGVWLKEGLNTIMILQLLQINQNASFTGENMSDREQILQFKTQHNEAQEIHQENIHCSPSFGIGY